MDITTSLLTGMYRNIGEPVAIGGGCTVPTTRGALETAPASDIFSSSGGAIEQPNTVQPLFSFQQSAWCGV